MDGNNSRPAQDRGNPGLESPDWRNQLSQDARSRIVNKILDTLKKYLPISGPDGLVELQKIAVRFEEEIYTLATSQTDYLRRISVKMLTVETKSQTSVANSSRVGGQNHSDAGFLQDPRRRVRPAQDWGNPGMESPDWRNQLSQDSRSRIVNKMLDILKKHLPISGPDGLVELQKIAVRFEEEIYTLATSQTDYLRRISLKMLTLETKSQTSVANFSAVGGQNHSDAASVDSTARTGHNAVDWQEEVYQQLKSMKEMYFMDISELHNRLSVRYQQLDALAQGKQSEQVEKIKMFRTMLERIMHILTLPKSGIQPGFKEKLAGYEKQIVCVLNTHRIEEPTPLLQQGQQPNAPAIASLSSMPQH